MNDDANQIIVVMVTVGSKQEGRDIASALVQENLAACVSFCPIESTYQWQGAVQTDQEWQLMIKTERQQFEGIETRVRSLHSYELPEIIAIPVVEGYTPYLSWVHNQSNAQA